MKFKPLNLTVKMKRLIIAVATVIVMATTLMTTALAASGEGFAKGRTDPPYPGVDDAIPLLQSFYFGFGIGGKAVDHHINSIMVLPAGAVQDVSPNAEIPAPTVASGKIALMYRDKNGDDRYFYKVSHDTRPLRNVRRYRIRDVGCTGKCERILPQPPGVGNSVFVLVGFELFFTGNRDHHVDEIAIFEENRKLTVMLNDKNDDDVFGYVVDYAWVSPLLIDRLGEESGTATGGARVALPRGRKVIRGFHFDFLSNDHHLREIGVLTSNQNLEVFYGDKNGDDRFRWHVDWAIIGPQVITN